MEDMTIKYEYDFSYDDIDDLFDDEYEEETLNEAPGDEDSESSEEDTGTTDEETSEDTEEPEEDESSEEPEEEPTEDVDGEVDTDAPGDEDDSTEDESEESDDEEDENSDQSEGEKYIRLRYFESLSNMDENFEKLINKISLYKRNINDIGHLNELIQLESVCREAQNKISTIKISFINTIELDILKKINNEIQRIFIKKVNELKKLQDNINK